MSVRNKYKSNQQKNNKHAIIINNIIKAISEANKLEDYDSMEKYIKQYINALGEDNIQGKIVLIALYTHIHDYMKAYDTFKSVDIECIADLQKKINFIKNTMGFLGQLGKCEDLKNLMQTGVNSAYTFAEKTYFYSHYLYAMVCSCCSYQEILTACQGYNRLFTDIRTKKYDVFTKRRHAKIRVGYMSPDFREHVMFRMYYSMLKRYNKSEFEVTCYQLGSRSDHFTEHLKGMVDSWHYFTDQNYADMAKRIYEDEIDILVDLAGHTPDSGLPVFAYRPAPIQISGLGWMETTGLEETDYFITDRYVDSEDTSYLTEKPLYLSSQFCYAARGDAPEVNNAPCIKNGYVTFGAFNSWHKINDITLRMWKKILDRVPNSMLLLKSAFYEGENIKYVQQILKQADFDLNKIILEKASGDYLRRYLDVDIALDTYPYTGGGTTCDTLYMGVPLITMYGVRRGSRFSYSILKNIGLDDLAVTSEEDYVERAVALAEDTDLLNILHQNIRGMLQKSPVMNSVQYIAELEVEYKRMLNRNRITGD